MGQNNDKARVKQYREYLNAELAAAAIYGALADTEEHDDRAEVLEELTNWPTYFPAELSASEIAADMQAH